ncbi:MAG TPA: outer membrane beta-barrel protein, partial [Chitinophagaceae bacterium]|nr:outer membrane beta-barrel protein [Chitinophagaceae bacterium]
MTRRTVTVLITVLLALSVRAQQKNAVLGILTGNVMDEKRKALEGATVQLISLADTLNRLTESSDKDGQFTFTNVAFGHYKLSITYIGLQSLTLDSIWFRTERYDFNLTDITLKPRSTDNLETVVIYAEKPLVQSKDGNITFNAGESALAAGSNASDLLTNVPLVGKDPDGKITVRGKEPKILIDDKPVELNLQQLQDLLESLPGSSIDKIEVMTNPPPQYANEQGGVINIITKKGKVGMSGRFSATTGTRGDVTVNGSFTYRKQGLAININAGGGYSNYQGNGYSIRNNIYTDSSNFFNTTNEYTNKGVRPNFRANIDYDFNKNNLLNLVIGYNQNDFDNTNTTDYKNINRHGDVWKASRRNVHSEGNNYSPNVSASYTLKGRLGEQFRVIGTYNFSSSFSDRDFYQQFFHPDMTPNGLDSTQEQLNDTKISSYGLRVNYDRMLKNMKTFLSVGGAYNRNNNHVIVDASYRKKPEGTMEPLTLLSNDFWFHQTITNYRASVKQLLGTQFSVTAGTSLERTAIWFELLKEARDVRNDYWTWLPFANINKTWKDKLSITFAYRRSIRRPGIGELNPTIDFSDPYNIRFGNENLEASTAHNFDLVLGRTRPKYYVNIGVGHNIVEDIFSQLRTLLPDGKTQITWENISGRKEYEMSTWNGVTITKQWKVNLSASYTYNQYSEFDKTVRKFRNGGSFTSNINTSYIPRDVWNITASFNLNRFANPQGYARWNTSMNLGVQRKFFNKRLVITLNSIDPFANQQRRVFTYGTNFNLESYSNTRTRNFRLSVA